ncbi:zinc finger protein 420 isoform X2 [Colossoma macropomum]|uniref:zinc finger protein 420 isoform X2 n=1 Tax=Colossoma macropomum TaxID=42526 RepID=UPI00186414AA|nr:zinc finger protein 420 isoform X2 [Colossoma macropomum]
MTKLQLLHRALNERLMAAVEQIMEMVGGTVLEYEAETIRARKENEILRRRLRWMEGEIPTDWPDEVDPYVPEQPVSLADGPVFEGLAIKAEPVDASDCQSFTPDPNLTASVCTADLETVNPATSQPANAVLPDGTVWDSSHSYMAPLDFDPTMAARQWRGRGRSQKMSFACPDCGKVFGREQRLMFHMRIHSAERPYMYRRRKACFYGDKKRKKKLRGLTKLYPSKEIVEDLSDTSEQTEKSTGSASISAPRTTAPSAPEAETGEKSDEASRDTSNSKYPESSRAKPVGHRGRQGPRRSKIPQCLKCKKVFKSVSRLATHMKTHRKPFPSQEEQKEQEDTDKTDKRPRKHPKKPIMRNNEMEVERAKAGGHSLFQCPECKKIFARSCWLTFHLKSHERERSLARKEQKRLPSKQMQNNKDAEQHSTEVTKDTQETVAENSRAHILKKIFACPHCDKVFTREGWLGPHIRSHTLKTPSKSEIHLQSILPVSQKRARRTLSQLSKEDAVDEKNVTKELKRKSEIVSDQPTTITEPQKVTLESKRNSESKTSNNESERIMDKSSEIIEESRRIPDESTGEARDIPRSKKTFSCRECGKVYLLLGCLKTHKKIHKRERMEEKQKRQMLKELRQKERKAEEQSLVEEIMENIVEKKRKRKKTLLEMPHSFDDKEQTRNLDTTVMLSKENGDKSSDIQAPESKNKESAKKTSARYFCKHCGKVYARRNWLNMHMLGHREAMLTLQKKVNDEAQKSDDGQMPQEGSSTEDSIVQKEEDGGKVSYPCPFCDKVFRRGMRLMVHMQIHSGEKPYSYRQRKEQFYGDLTRPRVPDTYSQEVGEFMMKHMMTTKDCMSD